MFNLKVAKSRVSTEKLLAIEKKREGQGEEEGEGGVEEECF
jgi:hypothetical protein